MNDAPAPITFAELRRAAIGYAQDASGDIWTDYNLHDPGVTLLEQTCFALSQIGYQADFDVRDLLTDAEGRFAAGAEHPLYNPRKVLRGAPVTQHDLNAYLSDLPDVARAWVEPDGRDGLYDITVVPAHDQISDRQLAQNVTRGFKFIRPLCTDIAQINIAIRQRVILKGEIEVSANVLPERIAAELYYAVSVILRGLPYTRDTEPGATRDDVYTNPVSLLHKPGTRRARSPDLNAHLNVLHDIPGVRTVTELGLDPLDPETPDAPNFYAAELPEHDYEVGLNFFLNGTQIDLDASTIREEYMRISAEQIATTQHHIQAKDWDVRYPGKRREFDASHVDALLPRTYAAHGYRPHADSDKTAQYRSTIESHLSTLGAEMAALPETIAAKTDPHLNEAALHRQRIALLDYRIALQGETLPATHHTGMHHYRTARERHTFEITWRLRILFSLAELNATRSVGPGGRSFGGFMDKLGLFGDLAVRRTDLTSQLSDYGLSIDDQATVTTAADNTDPLIRPTNLFDMIVPLKQEAEPLDKEELQNLSPWCPDGRIPHLLFAKTADPDSFVLAPDKGFNWQLLFDQTSGMAPRLLDSFDNKTDALDALHRLRATWRLLHQRSEGAYLIEEVSFAKDTLPYTHNVASLLITGWTARTGSKAYRNYIASLVEQLAPAHIYTRIHWLDYPTMVLLEDVLAKGSDPKARAELRKLISTLEATT